MEQLDVLALGELLVDFTPSGISPQGNPEFEANPGGAPCNVLAGLSKWGNQTAFLGKVGKDAFGDQLEKALLETGIGTRGLMRDPKIHTTLAFVHKKPNGDRSFSFCRNPGADVMLTEQDLDKEMLQKCRIFHFGTLSMTHADCRQATKTAVAAAKAAGALVSFDPNLRESLWENLDDARTQALWGMGQCDILKISDNEILWVSGLEDYEGAVQWVQEYFPNIRLLMLTLGPDGSRGFINGLEACVAGFQVDTIETTGAGDTFMAAALHHVLQWGLDGFTQERLTQMLRFANAAAALVTTCKGALRVMPTADAVQALLEKEE